MAKNNYVSLDWVHQQAQIVRSRLGLSPLEVLDPFRLAESMQVTLIDFSQIPLPVECREQLVMRDPRGWSGVTLSLPSGVFVVLNPEHNKQRMRATLMEELTHIYLDHRPTVLITNGNTAFAKRSYDPKQEKEAYWVGAAALVPLPVLRQARQQRETIEDVAEYCDVSHELVRFRANITKNKLTKRSDIVLT